MNKDELQFIITRYDHYYDSTNNKGQFFLGLNTFILGGVGVGFFSIKNQISISAFLLFLTVLLACLGLISIYFTLKALIPFFGSKKRPGTSLIFFGSVAKLKRHEFVTKVQSYSPTEFEKDLSEQAHELAIGLDKKFHWLKWAGWLLLIQFILLIPFTYLIYQNLKQCI